jgi:serine/threonine protein kinase
LESIKGWGTYGLVAAGRNLVTGQPTAIKRISKVFDNLGDTKRILREIKILSNI